MKVLHFDTFLCSFKENCFLIHRNEPKVAFHSSSCLRGYVKMSDDTPSVSISSLPTDCMVFEEMSRVGKSALVSSVTLVTPITIALFAGPQRVTAAAFDNDEGELAVLCEKESTLFRKRKLVFWELLTIIIIGDEKKSRSFLALTAKVSW